MSDAAAEPAPAPSETVLTAEATPPAGSPAPAPAPAAAETLLTDDAGAKAGDAGDAGADGDKPKEGEGGKEGEAKGAPEEYAEFEYPENFKPNEAATTEFKAIAKEIGLSQQQAQKLVDLQTRLGMEASKGYVDQLQAHVDKTAKEWADTAKADPEIGGAKFDENVAVAKKALDTFGTPELKALLKESRIGNHPEVIRLLFKAGQAITQDGFQPGRSGGGAPKSAAEVLYGSTKTK